MFSLCDMMENFAYSDTHFGWALSPGGRCYEALKHFNLLSKLYKEKCPCFSA
jgi:hypothetical protein